MPHAKPGKAAYDLKAIGRQVRKDGLGDARTLLGRNPIVIEVRVAIALRVFDERCMDEVCDQLFYSIGQCCLNAGRSSGRPFCLAGHFDLLRAYLSDVGRTATSMGLGIADAHPSAAPN